ncbi:MAG: biotin transporter BioY [Actinobacteria bacterium]|nr:biotin transporter BioY [Actinomycetota bacterium]NIS35851.1 biotin transporter BioY [Actinomycetota bacterium]NIT98380.1 biotin transporter BioY [Actinomycetota bacterium]NIU70473.1 biotin transporter BioY [Actinomycetota bacterium]NIV58561.1 biotin transporter BioY [Actinomycetota bacterium]
MTTVTAAAGALSPPTTLLDTIPRSRVRDVVAVVGFALLTAGAAQISIGLGFTPVPLTGQTFAVLLAGGTLGAGRGAASQGLYVVMGAVGLPFYADGEGGWEAATGATAGYLVGFVVAAYFVGWLAERGQDRQLATSVSAFIAGSVIIYTLGAGWLAYDLDIPLTAGVGEPSAIAYGVAPFIVGDIIKALLAGSLLPAAWRLTSR